MSAAAMRARADHIREVALTFEGQVARTLRELTDELEKDADAMEQSNQPSGDSDFTSSAKATSF
jgi:hypothetical protein